MKGKSRLVFIGSEGTVFRNFSEVIMVGPDGLYDRLAIPGMTLVLSEGERNRRLWAHLPEKPQKMFVGRELFWKGVTMGIAFNVVLIGLIALMV